MPDPVLLTIGAKLANFRRKLANSIGEKKIKQIVFGEMYGGYTKRQIETYEGGMSEIPAKLLFLLWQQGHNIDALFSEGNISDPGRECARALFDQSITAQLDGLNPLEAERLKTTLEETKRDKTRQVKSNAERAARTSGKRKRSHTQAGKIKKR
jgi:hypothetical protein